MKSGKPKKLLKEVPQNEWLRFDLVRRRLEEGKSVSRVFHTGNGVIVGCWSVCESCGKTYELFPKAAVGRIPCVYVGTGRFCSSSCANFEKGAYWRARKRDPNQFHRGKDHHWYGKDFKKENTHLSWNDVVEVEIPLSEAFKYRNSRIALKKGLDIVRIYRKQKGAGGPIVVVHKTTCVVCKKEFVVESIRLEETCSKQCKKILRNKKASKALKQAYASGKATGNRGKTAWNKGRKVDKSKYPNWGRQWWLNLDEKQRIERMKNFAKPRRIPVFVQGKKISVRSKFEQRIVALFEKKKIEFEYESSLIQLDDHSWYMPDFYLPMFDVFVEAKALGRLVKYDKMSKKEIRDYIRIRKKQVKAQTGKDLHFLWYERFYGNPEGSLSKMLNKKVERNPQRPEVEDSITNNTSVGSKKYA